MLMQTLTDTKSAKWEHYYFPLLIVLMAVLSYIRIFFLNNVYWDDHLYLQVIYTSNNISDFLNTGGWFQLRRVPQGIIIYLMLNLFKISNHAYIILHLITIATQIITPIFLYLLINKLYRNRIAAFIIGSSLIIYPLDTTVPVFTTLMYRFGLMFSVISFYLTRRAFADKIRWFYMIIALLISGVSHYFFVEATVALEPARLFLIGFILHNKGYKINEVINRALKYWSPFFLLCVPLVLYKLLYKPYGIYAGFYTSDILFFLRWKLHLRYLAMLFFGNWVYLLGRIEYLSCWSVISGLIALLIAYYMLRKRYEDESGLEELGHLFILPCPRGRSGKTRINMIIVLGLLLLVPVVIMHELFADTPLGVEYNTRRGCIMQFGNALIIGGLICIIINRSFTTLKHKKQYITLSVAALLGLGTFFNNLNIDRYFELWEQQKQFYTSFIERFPALPKKSTFIFDIQANMPLKGFHYAYYNAAYYINMLYAESKKPEKFREHKVAAWWFLKKEYQIDTSKYEMGSHWGNNVYDTRELIVIRWQPGEFLVNREIVNKYPHVHYKYMADKDIPIIPSESTYPLRGKMKPFLVP